MSFLSGPLTWALNKGGAAVGASKGTVAGITDANQPAIDAAKDAQAAQNAQIINPGTSYEGTYGQYNNGYNAQDQRNYMYGRDPNAANAAVGQALQTGAQASNVGANILSQDTGLAADARGRVAPTGDFSAQNLALGNAQSYGNEAAGFGYQLAGLESTQGPSAAQAQLGMGTNQALASQLALARSGRGFGGGAAAMGQAQSNAAGIQANQANQSALLRAQEDAAWRARQAANLGNSAGIFGNVGGLQAGVGQQFGQQATTNLGAALQTQAQNDQASLGYLGQGATAYGQGVAQNLAGQGLANNIRGAELGAGMGADDRALRAWAAAKGFDIQQKAADAQQTAALIQGGATVGGALIGSFGGPGGAAAGAQGGNAGGKALADWSTS